jgi:hypothetical protein
MSDFLMRGSFHSIPVSQRLQAWAEAFPNAFLAVLIPEVESGNPAKNYTVRNPFVFRPNPNRLINPASGSGSYAERA